MFDIQNRRYIGNKFKLMDWISNLIDKNCDKCHSFFDVFAPPFQGLPQRFPSSVLP